MLYDYFDAFISPDAFAVAAFIFFISFHDAAIFDAC